MRAASLLALVVLVVGFPGLFAAAVEPTDDKRASSDRGGAVAAKANVVTDEPTGPVVLYWDEKRESLTATPIPGARTVVLSLADRQVLRRSDAGLRQVDKADLAEGTTVDLGGRYQSVIVSLVDLSGRLRVICLDAEPGAQVRAAAAKGGPHAH
jgi:hypothetical protein